MRFLFCFANGLSHFEPMVPVARAAQASGHSVAVACSPWRVAAVETAGFTAFGIGPFTPQEPPARLPLQEVDMAREEQTMRESFARRAGRRRATGIRALAGQWPPDLIVADEADFGAVIAAEALRVPHAVVLVLAAGSLIRPEVVADTLDQIRAEQGLTPDPEHEAPGRYLVLTPFPPSLRDPAFPLPPTAHSFRAVAAPLRPGDPPPWAGRDEGDPLVYFTLGTQFNLESGDLFARVLAGLAQLPYRVVVTVGHQIDPAELGPQPTRIHIARFIPQHQILPHCDAVVFHGGSGTLIGASTFGLPMVLLAMGADQPANALRCQALGVGVGLDPVRVTPNQVKESVLEILSNPSFRRAAQQLQAEVAVQPEPSAAVLLLERLAAERRPILAGQP